MAAGPALVGSVGCGSVDGTANTVVVHPGVPGRVEIEAPDEGNAIRVRE